MNIRVRDIIGSSVATKNGNRSIPRQARILNGEYEGKERRRMDNIKIILFVFII